MGGWKGDDKVRVTHRAGGWVGGREVTRSGRLTEQVGGWVEGR